MKPRNVAESITDLTKNFLTAFIVGNLLFTIISDGVSALFWEVLGKRLETEFGINYNWLRVATVMVLIVLLLLVVNYLPSVVRWFQQQLPFFRPPLQTNVQQLTTPYPGLIVAMSPKDDSPAETVIRFHWNVGQVDHLKHCWIICTDKSLPYATKMIQRFTEESITQGVQFHYGGYGLPNISDLAETPTLLVPDDKMDDPNYIQTLVNCIYVDAALKELDSSEVIADYTGATKGMTAGILLACTEPDRPLQYISQLNRDIMSIRVSYKLSQVS